MNNYLWKYIIGYVKISISGKNCDRFINICANRNIYIADLYVSGEEIYLTTDIPGYLMMHKVKNKTQCIPTIISKHGLPFRCYRHRKRFFIPLGCLLALLLIIVANSFVWEVRIEGNTMIPYDELLIVLQNNDIYEGASRYGISEKQLVYKLKSIYDCIAFADVQITGTTVSVVINDRQMPPDIIKLNEPNNIYALKDGYITKMVIKFGRACVKEKQAVYAGQLLVEGYLGDTNDYPVCALADIYAEVSYIYSAQIICSQGSSFDDARDYAYMFNITRANMELGKGDYKVLYTEIYKENDKDYMNVYINKTENIAVLKQNNK